jgi:hypothetical protein
MLIVRDNLVVYSFSYSNMDTSVDETVIVNALHAEDKAVFTSLVELKDVFLKLFQDWEKS